MNKKIKKLNFNKAVGGCYEKSPQISVTDTGLLSEGVSFFKESRRHMDVLGKTKNNKLNIAHGGVIMLPVNSRKFIFNLFIVLAVVFGLSGMAFGQTASVIPAEVPLGANVNEAAGVDEYFWQQITITCAGAEAVNAAAFTIDLPTDITIADTDGDADTDDEIALNGSEAGTSTATLAVNVASTSSQIVITLGVAPLAAADQVVVAFPIETATSTSNSSWTYTVTSASGNNDATDTVDLVSQVNVLNWATDYTGDDDSSSEYGDVYPAAGAAVLGAGLPDLVLDLATASTYVDNNILTANGQAYNGEGGNEVTYGLWASQQSGLSQIGFTQGQGLYFIGIGAGNVSVTDNEAGTMAGTQLDGTVLAEGTWYFYVTSDYTTNWVLGQSGAVTIKHYPVFNTTAGEGMAVDYDLDGILELGAAADDDATAMTLDGGGVLSAATGAISATGSTDNADIFYDVWDVDDNAQVYIFRTTGAMTEDSVTTSGSSPNLVVTGLGDGVLLNSTDLYEEDVDNQFNWDIDVSASEYTAAGTYYIYAVACDGKNFNVEKVEDNTGTATAFTVKHYPYLEFQDHYGAAYNVDSGENPHVLVNWGQTVDGDKDRDGTATIQIWLSDEAQAAALASGQDVTTDLRGGAGNEYLIATISDTSDAPADNRVIIDMKNAESEYGLSSAIAAGTYYVYGVIAQGTDTLVVQLDSDNSAFATSSDDRTLVLTHSPSIRPKNPVAGETVAIGAGDTYEFRFEAFDVDQTTSASEFVQAFMVPSGTSIASTVDWTTAAAYAVADYYWLINTTTGQDATNATAGAAAADGYYKVDFSTITTDMAGNATAPSGLYDVYFLFTSDGTLDAETVVQAGGQLFLNGVEDLTDNYTFFLTPEKTHPVAGDTITFTIYANDPDNAGEEDATGLAIYLNVPSGDFQLLDQDANTSGVQPIADETANFNQTVFENSVDSTTTPGSYLINFVEMDATPAAGTDLDAVAVGTFQVVVKENTSSSVLSNNNVTFNVSGARTTHMVAAGGQTVDAFVPGVAANMMQAPLGQITGFVDVEGRTDEGQVVNMFVTEIGSYDCITDTTFLSANGDSDASDGLQITLGENGSYTLTSVPAGRYDVFVEKAGWLTSKKEGWDSVNSEFDIEVKAYTTTTVNFTEADRMLAGDCAGYDHDGDAGASTLSQPNNVLGTEDFNAFSTAYNSTSADANWNAYCDMDGDGTVYIYDVDFWTTNFGNSVTGGDGITFSKKLDTSMNDDAVADLELIGQNGNIFTYAVMVDSYTGLHSYSVQMYINEEDWKIASVQDQVGKQFYAYQIKKKSGYMNTYASSIHGPKYIADSKVNLLTVTLEAKSTSPADPKIKDVTLIDQNQRIVNPMITNVANANNVPTEFSLSENYPNPFNPTTTIEFTLASASQVKLTVYNMLGQEVANLVDKKMQAGYYNAKWNAHNEQGVRVSSGMYFYRLEVDNKVIGMHKMLLLK